MADDTNKLALEEECRFCEVPNEIVEVILSYLSSYGELQEAKLVCKEWHELVLRIIVRRKRCFYESICNDSLNFQIVRQKTRIHPRYSHSSCVIGKSMYVFGGCSSSNTTFNDVHKLDLTTYKWTKLRLTGPSPPPKECASMVVHNNRLVIFGGWCLSPRSAIVSNTRFFNGVDILDVSSLSWVAIPQASPDMQRPCERAGHSACVVGDQMVVFGGAQRTTRYQDTWMLDLNTLNWRRPIILGKKPRPRFGHSQMTMNSDTVIVIGGGGDKLLNDVWLLNLKVMLWSEVQVHHKELEAPQLWCHPAVKVDDKIVIFSSSKEESSRDGVLRVPLGSKFQTYVLDCSNILSEGSCFWRPKKGSLKRPLATSLHTVVQGRGEFFIFGGKSEGFGYSGTPESSLVRITPTT